jgi:hypothetical protein
MLLIHATDIYFVDGQKLGFKLNRVGELILAP